MAVFLHFYFSFGNSKAFAKSGRVCYSSRFWLNKYESLHSHHMGRCVLFIRKKIISGEMATAAAIVAPMPSMLATVAYSRCCLFNANDACLFVNFWCVIWHSQSHFFFSDSRWNEQIHRQIRFVRFGLTGRLYERFYNGNVSRQTSAPIAHHYFYYFFVHSNVIFLFLHYFFFAVY